MSLEVGQILDTKYRIVRLIGEGGMGAVYEGEHTVIRRRVAIKVLHASAALQAGTIQRFEREAQAAGRIGNDHILEVIDLGTLQAGERYMVLEFLDGETLGARIARLGHLSPKELGPIIAQLLSGLGAAHEAGIIHRDLKPDNIFILKEKAGQRDFVKIIDFGISKFSQAAGDMSMTRTGSVLGTPYYMAPEQASGSRDADARSDVYAVGVILYECVAGRVPFDANTFNELLFKIVLAEPPKLSEIATGVDPAFASIISKAMARDAAHRFQTAALFENAVRAWMHSGASVSVVPAAQNVQDVRDVQGEAGVAGIAAVAPARSSTRPAVIGLFVLLGVALCALAVVIGRKTLGKSEAPEAQSVSASSASAPSVVGVPAPENARATAPTALAPASAAQAALAEQTPVAPPSVADPAHVKPVNASVAVRAASAPSRTRAERAPDKAPPVPTNTEPTPASKREPDFGY